MQLVKIVYIKYQKRGGRQMFKYLNKSLKMEKMNADFRKSSGE